MIKPVKLLLTLAFVTNTCAGPTGLLPKIFLDNAVADAAEEAASEKHENVMPEGNHNSGIKAVIEQKNEAIHAAQEVRKTKEASTKEERMKAIEDFKKAHHDLHEAFKEKLAELTGKPEPAEPERNKKDKMEDITAASMNHPSAHVVKEKVHEFVGEVKTIKEALRTDLKAAATPDEKKAAIDKAKNAFETALKKLKDGLILPTKP